MALINTLRNKMGKLLVAVVAVAILSFILADFLGQGGFSEDRTVGEIAGHDISLEEYQNAVDQMENQFMMSTNRRPGENDMTNIYQGAWNMLIREYAIEEEFEEVGLMVTEDEMWDRVQGRNIDPGIQQSFTNPETGVFDRNLLLQYLQSIPDQPAQQQAQWQIYKENLRPARERLKYENLLVKTDYVTAAEAKMEYESQNNVADVEYLYIPFYAAGDSALNIMESDLRNYYNEHKEDYKTEPVRDLAYITFPVVPSAEDTAAVMDEMKEILRDFETTQDDSLYATAMSEGVNAYVTYRPNMMNPRIQAAVDTMEAGDIAGPFIEEGKYKVVKLTEVGEDTVDYARASHILFRWEEDTPEARQTTRQEARRVLNEIKEGANFAAMAREYGQDGTATRGGDLGWFKEGDMVDEFQEAVFNASEEGVLDNLVETEYGYHIVRVDDVKQNIMYTIASVEREIIAGTDTENEAYRKADIFAAEVSDYNEFQERAEAESLEIQTATEIGQNDRRVPRLGLARQMVQWAFRDAEEGDVSEVFEVDGTYVVAALTEVIEGDYKPLEAVKEQVRTKVRNQKQGELLLERVKGMEGSLQDMADQLGDDASIYSMSDLKLSANSMTGIGYDPKAVGVAFGLEDGEQSEPFIGENGVIIIKLNNKTIAPDIADYEIYAQQLINQSFGRTARGITEAIEEEADIEDRRYKFY